MGLDCYLLKVKKQKSFSDELTVTICREVDYVDSLKDNLLKNYFGPLAYELDFDGHKRYTLLTQVAYWRKANMIHGWFYDHRRNSHIEDYEPIIIDEYKLKELLKVCKEVMLEKTRVLESNETSRVKELLPTRQGFFFGSYLYDKGYFTDVEETIQKIEKVLQTVNFEEEIVFYIGDY
jgi:hypothetical protein